MDARLTGGPAHDSRCRLERIPAPSTVFVHAPADFHVAAGIWRAFHVYRSHDCICGLLNDHTDSPRTVSHIRSQVPQVPGQALSCLNIVRPPNGKRDHSELTRTRGVAFNQRFDLFWQENEQPEPRRFDHRRTFFD
jgi:hypothetical protein